MHKFETKIKIWLHFVIIIALIMGIGITYYCIKRIFDEDYYAKAKGFISQYNQKNEYMIESLERDAKIISANSELIEILKAGYYDVQANSILNDAMKLDSKIMAISVYSNNFVYATDSIIGSVPDKDYIEYTYSLYDFFDSSREKQWMLRKKESYVGYYNRSTYDGVNGVYTCVKKIYNNDEYIGFLLLDINYEDIFRLYSEKNEFLGKINIFIHIGNEYIPSKRNYILDVRNISEMLKDEYFLPDSNTSIIISISKEKVYLPLKIFMVCIIVIALVCCGLSYVMRKKLINSIMFPMERLKNKISEYNKER